MRLPLEEHRRHPFRVHALASDFELLDVWAVPIDADAAKGETFEVFARLVASQGFALATSGTASRMLFAMRHHLGRIFGWDRTDAPLPIPGRAETTIAERLTPEDQARNRARPDDVAKNPLAEFKPIYRFEDEMLLELSNKTIHALVHIGWVPKADGKHFPEVAVYIKSRGRMSDLYMALIAPFRHRIVYPAWMRAIARAWLDVPRSDARAARASAS